jgi:hypothetical protein
MNTITTPGIHLRGDDLEYAREIVKWAATDLIHELGTEGISVEKMGKVGVLAGLLAALGVDVYDNEDLDALDGDGVTALRGLCDDIADVPPWLDADPLLDDRARKARVVLMALEAAA